MGKMNTRQILRLDSLHLSEDHFRQVDQKAPDFLALVESMRDLPKESHLQYQFVHSITVYPFPNNDGHFIVVDGARRLAAAQELKWKELPCTVVKNEDEAFWLALAQNLNRKDMTPLQRARLFQKAKGKFNLSNAQLGKKTGLAENTVSGILIILKLPTEMLDVIEDEHLDIPQHHLTELARLSDGEQQKMEFEILRNRYTTIKEGGEGDSLDFEAQETTTDDEVQQQQQPETKSASERVRSTPFQTAISKVEDVEKKILSLLKSGASTNGKTKATPLSDVERNTLREKVTELYNSVIKAIEENHELHESAEPPTDDASDESQTQGQAA